MFKIKINTLTRPYLKACMGMGLSARSNAQCLKIVNPTIAPIELAIPADIT